MGRCVLTFDFGASNGRALLFDYTGHALNIREIHRFDNEPIEKDGFLCWNLDFLFEQIKIGIQKAASLAAFDSIGIDTWGVDFGLLDAGGNLLCLPTHYRDSHTETTPDEFFREMTPEMLYRKTGIQIMRINTVFQMYHKAHHLPDLMQKCKTILFMPDLFAYLLTGEMRCEYTVASTSGMLDVGARDFDADILRVCGIRRDQFAPMIDPGQSYGKLKPELAQELHCAEIPVVAVATHDTASAVAAVPAVTESFTYISCGTWSLFGTELDTPCVTDASANANFTNEGGYAGKIRFLKNIMGLWLFQESRRQWKREGLNADYDRLDREAEEAEPLACLINPNHPSFEAYGDLPGRIREFCRKTGQKVPQTQGEIVRCIYESLAMKYRNTLDKMEELTGRPTSGIHMVGGGIKAKLLCRYAANACNRRVYAGPIEATATGNALVQFIALGEVKDLAAARRLLSECEPPAVYEPTEREMWEKGYQKFLKIVEAGNHA